MPGTPTGGIEGSEARSGVRRFGRMASPPRPEGERGAANEPMSVIHDWHAGRLVCLLGCLFDCLFVCLPVM